MAAVKPLISKIIDAINDHNTKNTFKACCIELSPTQIKQVQREVPMKESRWAEPEVGKLYGTIMGIDVMVVEEQIDVR